MRFFSIMNENSYISQKSNSHKHGLMTTQIQQKIISICNAKIEQKGENVGLSFYASFDNKNETPEL